MGIFVPLTRPPVANVWGQSLTSRRTRALTYEQHKQGCSLAGLYHFPLCFNRTLSSSASCSLRVMRIRKNFPIIHLSIPSCAILPFSPSSLVTRYFIRVPVLLSNLSYGGLLIHITPKQFACSITSPSYVRLA